MRMEQWQEIVIPVVLAVFGSGGLWTLIQKFTDRNDAGKQMLMGLAHDRLFYLCLQYIARNGISADELENLTNNLYLPYKALKGNGIITRLMHDVEQLPITDIIIHNKKENEP